MIPFTQCVMRYAVLMPAAKAIGVELQMSAPTFISIVITSMLISVVITRRDTGLIHSIVSAVGIIIGGFIILKLITPKLALAYVALVIMVWLYCYSYKRQFLIGNIYVALFAALTPLTVLLELPLIYSAYGQYLLAANLNLNFAVYWCLGVSGFIFLTVLSHEIIMDTEEFETEDLTEECQSLPFVMGAPFAKLVIIGINAANVLMLCLLHVFFLHKIAGLFSLFYILLLLVVPLLFISRKIHHAVAGADYHKAGNLMKLTLPAGIAYSGVIFFL